MLSSRWEIQSLIGIECEVEIRMLIVCRMQVERKRRHIDGLSIHRRLSPELDRGEYQPLQKLVTGFPPQICRLSEFAMFSNYSIGQ